MMKNDYLNSYSICFSRNEDKYELTPGEKKHIMWPEEPQRWDWENCSLSCIKLPGYNKVKIVIRSSEIKSSEYQRKKDVKIKYMLGFDIDVVNLQDPIEDTFQVNLNNITQKKGPPKKRWVLKLDEDHFIWQWNKDESTIKNSQIWKIYDHIIKTNSEHPSASNTFNVKLDINDDAKIIPVVYQPAIDSWKNFLREVHCYKISDKEYQVTLLFEGEVLRRHWYLEPFYKLFRIFRYGRTLDIETINVLLDECIPKYYNFSAHQPPIYSGKFGVEIDDDIHNPMPKIEIKYFFGNNRHPIIFVNTANHAMAEHDNNHRLWKWEYVPWEKDSAVVYGNKSRSQIEQDPSYKLKNIVT